MPGGQAEYLRVPQAQFGPIKIAEDGPDEQYLYLSDILPTAYQAVVYADTPKDGTLAVLGLGPVGQLAARIGKYLQVERVIGVDPVPERRAAAARFGVETIDPSDLDDTAAALIDLVDGRGPDAVIDAVGMEAHGHDRPRMNKLVETAQKLTGKLPDAVADKITDKAALDRLDALYAAVKGVRRGGTVSISGVYGGELDPMPMMEMFDRGIQLRMGQAHVKRWIDDLASHRERRRRPARRHRPGHPPSAAVRGPPRLRDVSRQDRRVHQSRAPPVSTTRTRKAACT